MGCMAGVTFRYHHQHLFLFVLTTILYPSTSLTLHCNNATSCAGKSYICSDEVCDINCNTRYACENTYFGCDDSYLHGKCQINCAGRDGCEAMTVTSYRDTNIVCTGSDSCDKMKIAIVGLDPNDKINGTMTSIGGYTDSFHLYCDGDGINECFLDCQDNSDFYSCIDVRFDCYTSGICRFKCENSNACCSCTIGDMFYSVAYENSLHCYGGYDTCIQEDPGDCEPYYGCIARVQETTPEPTQTPTPAPTNIQTLDPTVTPTAVTSIPTSIPPTTRPTPAPTIHGETEQPSLNPTKSPTSLPSTNPTLRPIVGPSDDPTLSPTLRPTKYPTQDPDKATCLSLIESIENVFGVTTQDFRTDNELQTYVMNSTKAVIYEAFKISHIYDMNELCNDFWRCFYLKLMSIRGNTILDINVCAWTEVVYNALSVKIADNANEMGAFMKKGLAWYLVDGPAYSGYDNVTINNLTRVAFRLVTPSPTGSAQVGAQTTEMDTPIKVPRGTSSGDNPARVAGAIVGVLFLCICALIIVWWWQRKNSKIKQELADTKQRVVDLEALTGVEGDGVELDNVVPEGEGGEGTVPMNTNAAGYHETNALPMNSNAQQRESVPSVSQPYVASVHEEMGPGSVVAAGVEMAFIAEALPELKDEDNDEDREVSSSSDDDDEMDALYVKKGSIGDALYGPGTKTKTDGSEEQVTTSSGKGNENNENDSD